MNLIQAEQPRNLSVNLFPHQLHSIYRMETIEKEQRIKKKFNEYVDINIGILADDVGSGKTLTMLGMICRDRMEWNVDELHTVQNINTQSLGKIVNVKTYKFRRNNCNLILVSHSIIEQWIEEIQKTDLKYLAVTTKKKCLIGVDDYDIIIVTPTMFNSLVIQNQEYSWKRFIYDEPSHIRVPTMKYIHCGFCWFMSATPSAVVNKHKNCSPFMREIFYYWWDFETSFKDVIIRNDVDFIKQSFQMPETTSRYYYCYQPMVNTMRGMVNSNILRMLEAENIEGAISLLGGTRTNKTILEVVKSRKMEEMEEIESKIRIYTMRGDAERLEEWTNRRTRLQSMINELDERFKNISKSSCCICLNELDKPVLEQNCSNMFCGKCLINWLTIKNSCPICKKNICQSDLVYISDKEVSEEKKYKTKSETIIEIIKNKKDGKFIIFSEYDETFSHIYEILNHNRIKYTEIKGAVSTRNKNITKFKNGDIDVIFLNSNYNGAGINLQEATDIILYHQMSDDSKHQILGRANRIGRKLPLEVHYLEVL